MTSIIRSNRFNYNPAYTEPRFYSFSTWADDITRYFASSSGVSCTPCLFLAFKCEKPVGEVIAMLENYFENKLAHLRNKSISGEASLTDGYSPLQYLLDGLHLIGACGSETIWICEDITEQNYNGAFTDFLCTVPHGFYAKKMSDSVELKSSADISAVEDEFPFGWDFTEASERTRIIYDNADKTYSFGTSRPIVFENTDDSSVEFNCIIPLYRCYGPDTGVGISKDSHSVSLDPDVYTPLGIWFNRLSDDDIPVSINLIAGAAGKKYTASWTLTVSMQIKPYYASNSFPLQYSDDKELSAGMSTFAHALSGITELSRNILNPAKECCVEDSITLDLLNRIRAIENALKQIKGKLGFDDIVHHQNAYETSD